LEVSTAAVVALPLLLVPLVIAAALAGLPKATTLYSTSGDAPAFQLKLAVLDVIAVMVRAVGGKQVGGAEQVMLALQPAPPVQIP
jgi:hypothetical protein